MSTYDYFIAGRWRNRDAIRKVLDAVRASGRTAYCFIEHPYDGDGIKFDTSPDSDPEHMMAQFEALSSWQTSPTVRAIFEKDMQGLRDAGALLLVFPAGLAAHMELGAAYGMGKQCYAIGTPEKPETLYMILDGIYPTTSAFLEATA